MSDFSIEISSENIFDARTKRYFAEVYGCYTAGYYRSAVVMLWTVVVTDILYKVQHLAAAYGDNTAKTILKEIEDITNKNPKSPEWETELVDKVLSRTGLLDTSEVSFLQSLQTHRHLSAHPVMTNTEALFSPNKETTRAHIRNVLESVLTKPPIMSRKVFDTFIEDIEQFARLGPGPDGLKTFLETKYFKHFSSATFSHLLKSMWRVTFKSSDNRAETNRAINVQALSVLFTYRKVELTETIKTERDWFSDVSFHSNHMAVMSQFFRENPKVFPLLNDALKEPFRKHGKSNLNIFANYWFMSPSLDSHLDEISRRIISGESLQEDFFRALCLSLNTSDAINKVYDIGICLYFNSSNYELADSRFNEVIRPYIRLYDRNNIVSFLKGCENCYNNQATGRFRAARDHQSIKFVIDTSFADIGLDDFPAFMNSLKG